MASNQHEEQYHASNFLVRYSDFAFTTGEIVEVILTDSLEATDGSFLATPFVYRIQAEALAGIGVYTAGDTISGQSGARRLAAVANFGNSEVAILENDGTGSFVDIESTVGLAGATALASGDWDGDEALDHAVANSTGNNVKPLENTP